MKTISFFTKKNVFFVSFFTVLGLIGLQIPFTHIWGSNTSFTLFDFFGPISTGFIGLIPGVIVVLLVQILNFLLHGAQVMDITTVIRFFPMIFAALYFSRKNSAILLVPIIGIIAFILHPIGREAWYYSMLWLIPIVCHFIRTKSLFFRALGTTFTAHTVGSVAWLYTFGFTPDFWKALIPQVLLERFLFAIGIAVMYVVFNNVLGFTTKKKWLRWDIALDEKYLWPLEKHI